jgi:hypothetical protein
MLGLRLDEPLVIAELGDALDAGAVARLEQLGFVRRDGCTLSLSARGRFLGGGVTADLLA